MTLKIRRIKQVPEGGPLFKEVVKDRAKGIVSKTEKIQKQIRSRMLGELIVNDVLLDKFKAAFGTKGIIFWENYFRNAPAEDATTMRALVQRLLGLAEKNVMLGSTQIDHLDLVPMDVINLAIVSVLQQSKQKLKDKKYNRVKIPSAFGKGLLLTEQEIDVKIQQILALIAISQKLNSMLEDGSIKQTGKKYIKANLYQVVAELEKQQTIVVDKDKIVDVDNKNSPYLGKLKATTKWFNVGVKGARQRALAGARQYTAGGAGGLSDEEQKEAADLLNRLAPLLPKIVGSRKLEADFFDKLNQKLENRITTISKSKGSTTVKSRKQNFSKVKASLKKKELKEQQLKADLAVLVSISQKGSAKKRRDAPAQRELNRVRMQINKDLAKTVEGNMGRPALENQSGTFANSVRLETLRQAPKSIVGEYSYMESPYATFENSDRWPSGYNPKPLITRSIRELAQQQLENSKFVLRKA